MRHELSTAALLQYAMLALPLAFAGLPLYIHAPDFYATEYHIPLATLGAILLAIRLFDAVQDPLIGYWSDRLGAHRPLAMFIALLILGGTFSLLFLPFPSTLPPAIAFTILVALATSAFSFLTINFQSLGGVWSAQHTQQMRIASYREAFNLFGLLVAVSLPALFAYILGADKSASFSATTFVLWGVLCTAGLLFWRWCRTHASIVTKAPGQRCAPNLSTLRAHWPLFGIYGLSVLSSSIPAVLVLFFIRDFLQAEAYAGAFLAVYFLAGALSMPLWAHLGKRIGHAPAWLLAMLLAAGSFVWAYLLEPVQIYAYGMICLFSGTALGAELALPAALLAQGIHRHAHQHNAATLYALLVFLGKLGFALASGAALLMLGSAGLTPAGVNTPQTLQLLQVTYALIPCIIKLVAAAALFRAIRQHVFEERPHAKIHQTTNDREYDHA